MPDLQELKDIVTDEISLVGTPAVPDAEFVVLYKGDGEQETPVEKTGEETAPVEPEPECFNKTAPEQPAEETPSEPVAEVEKGCDEYSDEEMEKACSYMDRHKGSMSSAMKKRVVDLALGMAEDDDMEDEDEIEIHVGKSLESIIEQKVEAILKSKETPVVEESTEVEKAAPEPVETEDVIAKAARLLAERNESARLAKESATRASINEALMDVFHELKKIREGNEDLRSKLDREKGRG